METCNKKEKEFILKYFVGEGGRKKLADKEGKKKGSGEEQSAAKDGKKKPKKIKATVPASKTSTNAGDTVLTSVLPTVSHSTDAIDMPVDPNEPTYCLCNQVSYGEMIGCDNPDVSSKNWNIVVDIGRVCLCTSFFSQCPIEWFHFACVKLTTKPKGKWYCPKCSSDRKKK